MKKTISLLTVLFSLSLSLAAHAQETTFNIPLPSPVTVTHTSQVLRITVNRPLEQCVIVTRTTNGFGRKLLREAVNLQLPQASGEPLPDGHAVMALDDLELSPEELSATALSLGKTWKPQASEDELSIILTGFLSKLGSRLMPPQALGPWLSQVLPVLQAAVNRDAP